MTMPRIIFDSYLPDGRRIRKQCRDIVEIVRADTVGQVVACIQRAQRTSADGMHAAGFVAYEAAGEFDANLKTHGLDTALPLAWFAVCRRMDVVAPPDETEMSSGFSVGRWTPSIDRSRYNDAIARIKDLIASGDTYQVNYTIRLTADFSGSPLAMFDALCPNQRAEFASLIETDEFAVCSLSPELFFRLEDGAIISKPMKGTARRPASSADDDTVAAELKRSVKDRAENAMIVDMIRNDIGRIATPRSIRVASAFDIEWYPTVFQMTSTVQARTGAAVTEIFRAMFPCASITGAPKVRTMQIIKELELSPRGVYCGAIGWMSPQRQAEFCVAIRTVAIDKKAGLASYGVGGGIVWDSDPDKEYEECLAKAQVLDCLRCQAKM